MSFDEKVTKKIKKIISKKDNDDDKYSEFLTEEEKKLKRLAKGPVRYNLKPGQALYDSQGNLISKMPGTISEKELAMLKKAEEKKSGPDLIKRAKGGMINKYAKGGAVKKNKSNMITTKGWGASRKT